MSDKERAIQFLDQIPECKMYYIIGVLEGAGLEVMTDLQIITILEMVDMILDGCESIDEAKKKVEKLIEQRKEKKLSSRITKQKRAANTQATRLLSRGQELGK